MCAHGTGETATRQQGYFASIGSKCRAFGLPVFGVTRHPHAQPIHHPERPEGAVPSRRPDRAGERKCLLLQTTAATRQPPDMMGSSPPCGHNGPVQSPKEDAMAAKRITTLNLPWLASHGR